MEDPPMNTKLSKSITFMALPLLAALLSVSTVATARQIVVPAGFVAQVFADDLPGTEALAFDDAGNLISSSSKCVASCATFPFIFSGEIYSFDSGGNRSLIAFNFSRPIDVDIDDDQTLYVTDLDLNAVYTIDLNGTLPVDASTLTPLVSGLNGPTHLEFGPDGFPYVSVLRGGFFTGGHDRIVKVDVTAGSAVEFIDFHPFNPNPEGKVFNADGDMFFSLQFFFPTTAFGDVRKLEFPFPTALPINARTFTPVFGGLDSPGGIDFGPDGKLYIATRNEVLKGDTGSGVTSTFASGLSGGSFNNLRFNADDHLFVTDQTGDRIIRICESTSVKCLTVVTKVKLLDLPNGLKNSLSVKLDNALASFENGNSNAAINLLNAFINQVEAKRGKKNNGLTDAQADELIACARAIIDEINGGVAPKGNQLANESLSVPDRFVLEGNYPNPFNPRTTIRFGLPESAHVSLEVYDMMGRNVRVLMDGVLSDGMHEASFDAGILPSGAYIYRLVTPAGSHSRTMLLLK